MLNTSAFRHPKEIEKFFGKDPGVAMYVKETSCPYACVVCGALVLEKSIELHVEWHKNNDS